MKCTLKFFLKKQSKTTDLIMGKFCFSFLKSPHRFSPLTTLLNSLKIKHKMRFLAELKIKLSCERIGNDEFGNEYFQHKKNGKRFVIYKGIIEPSKIPAEWHGWMHYTSSQPPINIKTNRYHWQKIHLPNLTGTKNSHSLKGDLKSDSKREAVSSDYQAWNPNEQNPNH